MNLINHSTPVSLILVYLPEDLGTGYCHTHGLGWVGDKVSPDQIVGEVGETSNGASTNNSVNIYWSLLVLRPACVDTLIITTQGKTWIQFSSENISKQKNIPSLSKSQDKTPYHDVELSLLLSIALFTGHCKICIVIILS